MVDEKIDVRDRQYVWCQGTVKMIVESEHRDPVILVHFDFFDESKDEVLFKNSPRLAKFGVYTSRTDIPRYQLPNQGNFSSKLFKLVNIKEHRRTGINTKLEKKRGVEDQEQLLSKLYENLQDKTIQQNNLQKWAQTQSTNQ